MKSAAALTLSVVSGLFSGIVTSACCVGPFLFASLGVSGMALTQLRPLRPYLLVVTYASLAAAFYLTNGRARAECEPGDACARSGANRLNVAALGLGTLIVLFATLFPWYSPYLFR